MATDTRRIVYVFDRTGIPLVLLDRDLVPSPARSHHDLVGIDNRRAGYVLAAHLLERGCRRVVFIGRPRSAPAVDARISGYREALTGRASGRTSAASIRRIAPT